MAQLKVAVILLDCLPRLVGPLGVVRRRRSRVAERSGRPGRGSVAQETGSN